MILHQLSRPFAFNKIVSTELNSVRYYVPGIITAVASGVYFILPKPPEILGDKRYLDYLLQIVGILPGFYIAALAAGATFANPSLDEPMPGKTPPTLKMRRMGQMHDEPLTTRLFICHLFAYLSAVSLMLAFAILVAIEINPSIEDILNRKANLDGVVASLHILQCSYIILITFYASKLTTITLHGLYFLAERMHLGND